jgi:hypothetical protein
MQCSHFIIGSHGTVVATPGGTFESNCVIPRSVFPEQALVQQCSNFDPSLTGTVVLTPTGSFHFGCRLRPA